MAGEGKTTIATTVACRLKAACNLGATFFFRRDIDDRSHPDHVISSIAFQLSYHQGYIADAVCRVLVAQPDVDRAPTSNQFYDLLLDPLQKCRAQLSKPIVIVLDAVDQCGSAKERKKLLDVLTRLPDLPPMLKVLISSRPEKDIRDAFEQIDPKALIQHDLSTGESRRTVRDDIKKYFAAWGERMERRYPDRCKSNDWKKSLDVLADRADGIFIWASTAQRFIEDEEVYDPKQQLEIVLAGTHNHRNSPSAVLDALYSSILSQAYTANASNDSLKTFKETVGSILTTKYPLPPLALSRLLHPTLTNPYTAYDKLYGAVSKLRSVLFLPTRKDMHTLPLRFIHQSFNDFLTSKQRAQQFFLDPLTHHSRMMSACIHILKPRIHDPDFSDAEVKYAFRSWCYHLNHTQTNDENSKDIKAASRHNGINFLRDLIRGVAADEQRAVHEILDGGSVYREIYFAVKKFKVHPFLTNHPEITNHTS